MSTANLTDHEALPPFLYRSGPSIDPHHREHVVQFYIDDASLLDGLSRFIGIALAAGDGALVIATKAHRDGLTQRLKARGMDPARPGCDRPVYHTGRGRDSLEGHVGAGTRLERRFTTRFRLPGHFGADQNSGKAGSATGNDGELSLRLNRCG
jgi:hypothetical protein